MVSVSGSPATAPTGSGDKVYATAGPLVTWIAALPVMVASAVSVASSD
jgi:hypothetical protein